MHKYFVKDHNNHSLAPFAYLVIVIAGLKAAESLIVPILMAFFWFLLFLPFIAKLRKIGFHDFIITIISFGITLVLVAVLGLFLISSSKELLSNIPTYQDKFYHLLPNIIEFLNRFDIPVKIDDVIAVFDPSKVIGLTAHFLKAMGGLMTDAFLTLIVVMFLFLESSLFEKKINYLFKDETLKRKSKLFLEHVNTYFVTKTATSITTGLIVFGMLSYFKLDHALLFGVLAFFLNYIPNIGSIIAAIPAVLLSLLQLPFFDTMMITMSYIVINVTIGNLIEPRVMGQGVGLSTFIVFVSLVFWGWMFGPVGMFLSVPLTVVIKIACNNSKELHWVAVLLSNKIDRKHNYSVLKSQIIKMKKDECGTRR
ncbi:MAG: AI-2E family transporter [Campylobacterota bacterium]|nr:AI-2E family transporter [Campylobacterota bacterium]